MMPKGPQYPSPEWDTAHLSALSRSRGVDRAVVDFIVHNMGRRAALAALDVMPVIA